MPRYVHISAGTDVSAEEMLKAWRRIIEIAHLPASTIVWVGDYDDDGHCIRLINSRGEVKTGDIDTAP